MTENLTIRKTEESGSYGLDSSVGLLREKINSVPTPSVLTTLIFSPCSWIISFTMARPRPGAFLVFSAGEICLIETFPDFFQAVFWNTDAGIPDRNKYFSYLLVVSTVMVESAWLNLMALSIRL